MEERPPFKDFYDKPLIPIGPKDLISIIANGQRTSDSEAVTHWLIGLIWMETTASNGWKVAVYPVCKNENDWNMIPFYQSKLVRSFEAATQLSKIIDDYARKDVLTSSSFKKEIANYEGINSIN